MLRLRAWLFFGVLLLIGILLVGTAPSFQACLKQGSPQAAATTGAAPQAHGTTVLTAQSTRECLTRFYTENRDDIIAAFALILLLSTIFLWFSSRDLVAGTHDFAKMQLRAYLGPSETFITGVTAGEKPVVECTIRNFGQTPAHRVSYWADCRLLNSMSDSFDRARRGRRAHRQSRPRRLHHQVATARAAHRGRDEQDQARHVGRLFLRRHHLSRCVRAQPQNPVPLPAWRRARVRHRGHDAFAKGNKATYRITRPGKRRSPDGGCGASSEIPCMEWRQGRPPLPPRYHTEIIRQPLPPL